jgi:hypothetical protein
VPFFRDRFGNLQRLTPTLPANEVFLRDRALRTFGNRTAEELAEKLLERELERLFRPRTPFMVAIDIAQVAYDVYTLTHEEGAWDETTTVDVPNPNAGQLIYPSNWVVEDVRAQHEADMPEFFGSPLGAVSAWATGYCGNIRHQDWPLTVELTAEQIMSEGWSPHTGFERTTNSDYVPDYYATKESGTVENPTMEPDTIPEEVVVHHPGEVVVDDIIILPRPAAQPQPITWLDMPTQQRHPWDDIGPDPQNRPDPENAPEPFPRAGEEPAPRPGEEPFPGEQPLEEVPPPIVIEDTQPVEDPGEDTQPQEEEQPVREKPRKPPGKGTKEKKAKVRVGKTALKIIKGIEEIPELLDVVNALWKVLPKECKSGFYKLHGRGGVVFYKQRWRASQAQRMADLYRCWTHLDLRMALEAIIANQLEDAFYAMIGQQMGKAARDANLGHGLQLGIWDQDMSILPPGFNPFSPENLAKLGL